MKLAEKAEQTDLLTFLGTAGARVMVAKQILASGGLWLNLGGTQLLLDPGPGCLVQATKRKLDPAKLKAIILSHRHLDHCADINIMIEAMTEGGFRRRGLVFAPADALNEDPVILHYLRDYVERIEVIAEGRSYQVDNVAFRTPLRHQHAVETYGIVFETPSYTISCIEDTRYFPELPRHYRADLVVINVVRLESGSPYDHLSLPDAREIITEIKPKVAILTHFGMTMWRARPWDMANRLSEQTGVRVLAARDGMRFDLKQLESPQPPRNE